MNNEIIIDHRFRGPPNSGNGGYSCGLLASYLDGCAEVKLTAPPPLNRPLQVEATPEHATLFDGDTAIGSARGAMLEAPALKAPSLDEARNAAKGYVGFHAHPLPGCFVCGPEREPGDALRIFTGPNESGDMVAAPWLPDMSLADDDGTVRPEIVWAALDCPGFFGLMKPDVTALLGRMTAQILEAPRADESAIVIGWGKGSDGRKHMGGSALYSEAGALLAYAETLWIEIKGPLPQ